MKLITDPNVAITIPVNQTKSTSKKIPSAISAEPMIAETVKTHAASV